jgi:hypothetical protein
MAPGKYGMRAVELWHELDKQDERLESVSRFRYAEPRASDVLTLQLC